MPNYKEKLILDVLDFIEINLTNEITVKELALKFHISINHLQNLFYELTSYTLSYYLKRRRLTEAAIQLVITDKPILDIAFEFCYNSQESFTRVFKTYFHITPGKYRKENQHRPYSYYFKIKDDIVLNPNKNIIHKTPSIITLDEIFLNGIEENLTLDTFAENTVWPRFQSFNINENAIYSVFKYSCSLDELTTTTPCSLFIGCEYPLDKNITDVIKLKIPSGKYAIFKYFGFLTDIDTMYKHIFSEWFPNSPYTVRDSVDFELYELFPNIAIRNTVLIYVPIS